MNTPHFPVRVPPAGGEELSPALRAEIENVVAEQIATHAPPEAPYFGGVSLNSPLGSAKAIAAGPNPTKAAGVVIGAGGALTLFGGMVALLAAKTPAQRDRALAVAGVGALGTVAGVGLTL